MRKNLTFFATGTAFFLLFVFFSYLVHKNLFVHFDFDTTVRLQNNVPRRFDELFSYFSSIGSFEPMLIVLVVLLLIWRKIIVGVMVFLGFVAFHVLEIFGKFFVNHPPPPEFMLRTQRVVQFDQFHVRAEYSYPSGHSGRAIFIGTVLIFIIWNSRWSQMTKIILTSVIGMYVLIMLISRVYLGEHWLTDVIGGSILAFAFSCFSLSTHQLRQKLVRKHTKKTRTS